jgi:hypothetical protein
MTSEAFETYGRLTEGLHAGYTFERCLALCRAAWVASRAG